MDVLPVYLHGTHQALPKGTISPRSVELMVVIGTPLPVDELRRRTVALPKGEAPPIAVVAGWPYYLSKIYQEKTALRFYRDTGVPVVVLNPSLLLGPGDERPSSTDVVFKLLERRIPAMPSGGLSFLVTLGAGRNRGTSSNRARG